METFAPSMVVVDGLRAINPLRLIHPVLPESDLEFVVTEVIDYLVKPHVECRRAFETARHIANACRIDDEQFVVLKILEAMRNLSDELTQVGLYQNNRLHYEYSQIRRGGKILLIRRACRW